ncbi:MAG: 3-isopropylmalate dehydratase small subunit [Planctomycetota bacterium]|nr:3-isopropylmalate dehydratase small subunit [Planctomycetota bacterium]MCX8039351.1 3-isopropylmalate dehydratase small subunit [Planctomycetota bacterium]MDW8373642.1 3-isopropylmalate dehydratase small subunit [Planctomycetota bacterium]
MPNRILEVSGRAVPVRGNDIDTDRIIPARFLRCVTFDGLGQHAFADDRAQRRAQGGLHPFDDPRFAGASILLANANFGCGSSREHAPQALARWGIRAIVAVSYSEIFHGNCVAIGVPAVRVSQLDSERLQDLAERAPTLTFTVDLERLEVRASDGTSVPCQLAEGPRRQFLSGSWDALGELLEGLPAVRARAAQLPYLRGFA